MVRIQLLIAAVLAMSINAAAPVYAVVHGEPMIWGCNAHLSVEPYSSTPSSTMFQEMHDMGMTYCRIDVDCDENGVVIGPVKKFDEDVSVAPKYGIKLLVMLYMHFDLNKSWKYNYDAGYKQAYNFVKLHGANLDVIELGNELDALPDFSNGGSDDGQVISDYNSAHMHILAGYFTGMCDGAHTAKPGIRCAIDSINHPHFGWFQVLENEKVPWDITAVHWYSSSGSIINTWGQNGLTRYSQFGRPIWVTEVNNAGGNQNGDAGNINGLMSMINDMYPYPTVEAIIPYEMYDEPMWKSQGSFEGYFGLYASPVSPKPVVQALTQFINSHAALAK